MRRPVRVILSLSALAAGLAVVGLTAAPATADSASPSTCLSDCTAVFDTVGSATFTAPPAATQLTATVEGAAGAPSPIALTIFPDAVGGPGGATTVDLGPTYAGRSFDITVGGTGGGSSIASGGSLLAVAGGGGGGGYAGLFDLADQIFASYPGGSGGSPSGPGVAAGSSGAAFGTLPANGGGGTAMAGAGGTGDASGTDGTAADGTAVVAGGTGGSLLIGTTTYAGGAGGSGYTGGGGGAIARNVPNGDTPVDVAAPGGGGSGFLASGLTATAGAANTGAASVTFTWSFSPTASTTSTTVHRGDTVTVHVAGLPSNVAFAGTFDGVTVLSGTSDASGAATVSFTVAASQALGSFPVQIVVGGAVAASTSAVTVASTATLAATGVTISSWMVGGAALLVAAGTVLMVLHRRRLVRA